MKTDNLTIIPPEGMEAYQEGNEIKFRPVKKDLTYESVAKELFKNSYYYINFNGEIEKIIGFSINVHEKNNCTSFKQAQKLLAINQLLNVAKYLNGDWKPDWNDVEKDKYYIRYNSYDGLLQVGNANVVCSNIVYFRSSRLAYKAIEILGEEIIRLALSTDW